MGKLRIAVLAFFVAIALTGTAYAGVTSANLNVSATVIPWCGISVGSVAFGDYSGTQIDAALNVSVKCTNTTAYTVTMDAGQNYNGSWRGMTDGTSTIIYGLYKPSLAGEWGDAGYGATYTWGSGVSGTGTGGWNGIAGVARLFGGQAPTPGAYADVVVAAVNF